MDKIGIKMKNENVICCFCGKTEKMKKLIRLVLYLNVDEQQVLWCHKNCISEKLCKDVMLHPDLEVNKK